MSNHTVTSKNFNPVLHERIQEALAICDFAGMKPDKEFCRNLDKVVSGEKTVESLKSEILANAMC
ncbi:MAG: antitoxin VbhA family protein [Pseudomonadota bacterium]